MSETNLERFLCTTINALGYKAIRSKGNSPAPVGTHISVGVVRVDQLATHRELPSRDPESMKKRQHIYGAQVGIWEVEGDGEQIRAIARHLETDAFRAAAKVAGFPLLSMTSIMDMSHTDGDFWVRQRRMETTHSFMDEVTGEVVPMESVSTPEAIEV